MVYINLLDTGYLKPTNEGTRLSTTYRANAGTAFALRNVDFKPAIKANNDATPNLNATDFAEVNVSTFENIKITMTVHLDMANSTEAAYVYELMRLCMTKGYKVLYYPSTGSDASKQLVYQLANAKVFTAGEQTAFSLAGAYRKVPIFIDAVNFVNLAKTPHIATFDVQCTVTKQETSVI